MKYSKLVSNITYLNNRYNFPRRSHFTFKLSPKQTRETPKKWREKENGWKVKGGMGEGEGLENKYPKREQEKKATGCLHSSSIHREI
jgi:hypothetical protein